MRNDKLKSKVKYSVVQLKKVTWCCLKAIYDKKDFFALSEIQNKISVYIFLVNYF